MKKVRVNARISEADYKKIIERKGDRTVSEEVRDLILIGLENMLKNKHEALELLMRELARDHGEKMTELTVMLDEYARQRMMGGYDAWKRAVRDRTGGKNP